MKEDKGRHQREIEDDVFDEDDEDTMMGRYLTFQLADEQFGLPIRHVTEIIDMQRITDVPELPDYVKGVINLRGQVIPAMDVRMRFGLDIRDYDDRTCIVVVDLDGTPVGLIVDRVAEVLVIDDEQIDPPPSIHKGNAHRFVAGMGKTGEDVKILLDVEKLLAKDELDEVREAVAEPSLA